MLPVITQKNFYMTDVYTPRIHNQQTKECNVTIPIREFMMNKNTMTVVFPVTKVVELQTKASKFLHS